MDTEMMLAAARVDVSKAARAFNRTEVWSAITKLAEQMRAKGETIEKARLRLINGQPEGKLLHELYSKAAAAPVIVVDPRETRISEGPGAQQRRQIEEIATQMVADGRAGTMVEARAMAWKSRPDIYASYSADMAQVRGGTSPTGRWPTPSPNANYVPLVLGKADATNVKSASDEINALARQLMISAPDLHPTLPVARAKIRTKYPNLSARERQEAGPPAAA